MKAKVVGLKYHKVEKPVSNDDYLILVADNENEFDSDAIAVYNSKNQLIGHLANSERTLSENNRKNGSLSASEIREFLDFENHNYLAEVMNAYRSCIYLKIKWASI